MTLTRIPDWTADGLLPVVGANPVGADRSPFRVSLVELIERFGATGERTAILAGFLEYRSLLHSIGLADGIQWIDGSFAEDIESRERRAPNDIDVVTFFRRPEGTSQLDLITKCPEVFDRSQVKQAMKVDSYLVDLGEPAEKLIEFGAYWYSVWSHRRDQAWKGYLEVTLQPGEDAAAQAALRQITGAAP